MDKKRCIFHVPNYIDKASKSGSNVRPQMMIKAFEENGYIVDYVMGYGKDRKNQISKIKENIKNGMKYDFLYAENATTPTLLTEKNHLPRYPLLDFGFFKYCKKHGIKIGLFYRDIYWKFPIYAKEVSLPKRLVSIPMFQYDLKKYKQLVDILYLPSERMKKYLGISIRSKELPPGCNEIDISKLECNVSKEQENKPIKLFYVGGIGDLYDLTELLKTVSEVEFAELTVCCREAEWEARKEYYQPYLNDRVQIVHASGEGLKQYYEEADICMLFFESEEYRSFAMPIKLFEYLGNNKPIIATNNTAAGEFVEKNKVGWKIPFDSLSLKQVLEDVHDNTEQLSVLKKNIKNAIVSNTWRKRAEEVAKDLM